MWAQAHLSIADPSPSGYAHQRHADAWGNGGNMGRKGLGQPQLMPGAESCPFLHPPAVMRVDKSHSVLLPDLQQLFFPHLLSACTFPTCPLQNLFQVAAPCTCPLLQRGRNSRVGGHLAEGMRSGLPSYTQLFLFSALTQGCWANVFPSLGLSLKVGGRCMALQIDRHSRQGWWPLRKMTGPPPIMGALRVKAAAGREAVAGPPTCLQSRCTRWLCTAGGPH